MITTAGFVSGRVTYECAGIGKSTLASAGTARLRRPTQLFFYLIDFYAGLVEGDVPNRDGTEVSLGRCQYRFWTLGEIVSLVIKAGFTVAQLDEHPDWTDPAIPDSFTLLAFASNFSNGIS